MRRIVRQVLIVAWLALSAPVLSLSQSADPAREERQRWEQLHREIHSALLTDEACTARFTGQLRATRTAARAYLDAVAAGYLMWAREREESAARVPDLPLLDDVNQLLAGEAAEADARLQELAPMRALDEPVAAVRRSQEKSRFDWRALPGLLSELETRLAPLALRADTVRAMLQVQQGPLRTEAQRLQAAYDVLESEVSRRCAGATQAAPDDDPFVTPTRPARPPSTRKKN
jgi:hypothetical protein